MGFLTVNHSSSLSSPWSVMPPLRLGKVRPNAADLYVTISEGDRPLLRVDIYGGEETFCFTDAIVWGQRVFAGFGDTLYVIDAAKRTGSAIALGSYFGSFFGAPECLLVASGECLLRLSPAGLVLWKSRPLGLDGIIITGVENGLIKGEGEWDPPGGWKPFAIALDTGLPIV